MPIIKKFERMPRYVVFKYSDMNYLTQADQREVWRIGRELDKIRGLAGKQLLDCVVVESDWPEFEPTYKAIEERMGRDDPL